MRIGVPAGWALLRQRDFRLLWSAHAGSVIGDGFHAVAATWLVFETLGGGPEARPRRSAHDRRAVIHLVRAAHPLFTLVMAGVFLDGVINLLIAHSPTLALASLAFFALGASNGVLNAALAASLQLTVPTHMRGRTFATFSTAINLTTPISLAVTGALAATAGPVLLISMSGLGLMAVGAAGLAAWVRLDRATRLATA